MPYYYTTGSMIAVHFSSQWIGIGASVDRVPVSVISAFQHVPVTLIVGHRIPEPRLC